MRQDTNKVPFLTKIRLTILCMLANAGVIHFYDTLRNFTPEKSNQVLGIILFGIAFAYSMNYDFGFFKRMER